MKILIAYFIFMVSVASANDAVDQIISEAGIFAYSDGSSYFAFRKDGQFESGPMGESGRTINGTWTKDRDDRFVVKGKWGWMNGVSPTNDFRTMRLSISSYSPEPYSTPSNALFGSALITNRPAQFYKVYAVIDSLIKGTDKQPQQSGPAYPPQGVGSADP